MIVFVRMALLIATIGCGLSAGFFFTYEVSVTVGLKQVSDVTYVETFQAINGTIRNPWFGIVFFGTIPLIVLALVLHWRQCVRTRALLLSSLAFYLAVLVITVSGNVPLNEELAMQKMLSPELTNHARLQFEHDWNQLNLYRALLSVASFVFLAASITQPSLKSHNGECQPNM